MNNRTLFMIIGNEVKYLQNSTMDHREWYVSLGYDSNQFDSIVRGFVENNRIIYYKGSTFSYDDEVIRAAKMFTPNIRFMCSNPSLEVYCGIYFQAGEKWEPILRIKEDEITGFTPSKEKKENTVSAANTSGPILELKNDFGDQKFIKTAIVVTTIVLVLTFFVKILLFSQKVILNTNNFTDILLAIGQIALLGITIYGYLGKKEFSKYTGIVASILILLTFLVDM